MYTYKSQSKKQANFLISIAVIDTLKVCVPPRKQSEFVENAISRALRKEQFALALNESRGSWLAKDHPRKTADYIRSLRNSKRA